MRALCLAEGKFDQALYYAERAYRAAPDHAGVLADYGALLAGVSHGKRAGEALPLIERAIALEPSNRQAHFAYVAAMFTQGRIADALVASRRALAVLPGDHDLSLKLVAALLNVGLADEAVPVVAGLLAASPDALHLAETMCTVLNYDCTATPARVLEAHRNFGRLMTAAYGVPRVGRVSDNAMVSRSGTGGRLRVGFVSPDLRVHSVGFFAEPILAGLDRARFEVFVYDTARAPDEATKRFRGYPATWRASAGLVPGVLAKQIAGDELDVVVELSGLTGGHSLPALATLAAQGEASRRVPVIATYLGYPATTGLPAISARIVDGITDPEPGADALATERLVRLDGCFVCFRAPTDAPTVTALPAAAAGAKGITFGSFNALTKLNRAVLEAWARVLARVPGSRLLVKARELASADCRAHLMARCRAAGMAEDRVEIVPPATGMGEHLGVYGRVDIALDTFPYCGTTTTCDALWMGVPVVSVAPEGGGHASRVGLSLLSAVGLGEWCETTVDGYVARAVQAAGDVRGLAAIRAGLRDRMRGSVLGDEAGFAARFGAALERVAGLRG